ncbi:uncharacterized protein PV09_07170 [Verruconis gallopava]|uniref:SAM domain-containing protein n=1 Tax=Verruconis gallopava TaxID=253628 RepID=A0A0D1XGS5_9PEZI|nr:uncharacterized protein PV09_07170 [Verruconis gallopava]KIW01406.1 hypothetical protein PV09_07170 [Verruconis gallopava]
MAAMAPLTPITPLDGEVEMFTRGKMQPLFSIDSAFSHRQSMLSVVHEVDTPSTLLEVPAKENGSAKARPLSEFTEIFDELDEIEDELSEFEEDSEEGTLEEPQDEFDFQMHEGRRSQSTISTYDEIATPQSVKRMTFPGPETRRSVEGPRGPHLFRASTASELSFDFALQLSPIVPKKPELVIDTAVRRSFNETTPTTIANVPATFQASEDQWNQDEPDTWTAEQVSLWMYKTGIDSAVIEKFEHHDITGRVLLDLQFDDLKDIGIESFGKRHELWSHICSLRDGDAGISPVPTPFQDTSPRRSQGSRCSHRRSGDACDEPPSPNGLGSGHRRRRRYRANPHDPITPMDSVSIVAIEQLIPRPHKCSKGENCSKWKKQQRLMKRLQEEHGFPISPENGGHIWMAGDPGNARTAPNLVENAYRPVSEAEPSVVGPSVVASSDVLGPGDMPTIALQADALKRVQERDAQDNVKNFLALQHVEPPAIPEPTSPLPAFEEQKFEMFPAAHVNPAYAAPLTGLQTLPRLQIPRAATAVPVQDHVGNLSAIQDPFSAFSSSRASLVPNGGMYRFGTPASDMDVPVTNVPLGPISRDTSQSVPPNMIYRDPIRNSRQDWRIAQPLPSLNENEVFSPATSSDTMSRRTSEQTFGSGDISSLKTEGKLAFSEGNKKNLDPRYPGVNHAGWMKKRKTKLLRHEWNEHHFRLSGNQLKMHQNDIPQAAILETLNIDEYAVACSSIASNKLAAKLKALKIAKDKEKDASKDSSFEFQLVPDQMSKQGKSHHFAVKTRDERIDWMRELMLAKALRAKKDGLVVEVNGKEV